MVAILLHLVAVVAVLATDAPDQPHGARRPTVRRESADAPSLPYVNSFSAAVNADGTVEELQSSSVSDGALDVSPQASLAEVNRHEAAMTSHQEAVHKFRSYVVGEADHIPELAAKLKRLPGGLDASRAGQNGRSDLKTFINNTESFLELAATSEAHSEQNPSGGGGNGNGGGNGANANGVTMSNPYGLNRMNTNQSFTDALKMLFWAIDTDNNQLITNTECNIFVDHTACLPCLQKIFPVQFGVPSGTPCELKETSKGKECKKKDCCKTAAGLVCALLVTPADATSGIDTYLGEVASVGKGAKGTSADKTQKEAAKAAEKAAKEAAKHAKVGKKDKKKHKKGLLAQTEKDKMDEEKESQSLEDTSPEDDGEETELLDDEGQDTESGKGKGASLSDSKGRYGSLDGSLGAKGCV